MKVYIYEAERESAIIEKCKKLISSTYMITKDLDDADIAIAPFLMRMLPAAEINRPKHGALIFHPSLLPRHRGADAIKWAFRMKEQYTGVTWFWPNDGIDTGPICEQEVLAIKSDETPREFYNRAVIPAAIRTLARALKDIEQGHIRRVPQIIENGSYEPKIKRA